MTITANSIDRTDSIDWQSFAVEQMLTSQVDSCYFEVLYDGVNKTWRPEVDDEILITHSGSNLFGGIIVRVSQVITSKDLISYRIEAASYERQLDRYLVANAYASGSGWLIINSLFNDYINKDKLVLGSFESEETWVNEAGTGAIDSTYFTYGTRGRKDVVATSSNFTMRKEESLDLTFFDNNYTSTTADWITLWVRLSNRENVKAVRVRFGLETSGTYTNYAEYEWTGSFRNGWQQLKVLKSGMNEVGTFDWSSVETVQVHAETNANGACTITFDDVRMVKSSSFTLGNALELDGEVKFAKFNYEPVRDCLTQIAKAMGYEWYVDAVRDVHIFAISGEVAPFSLTDTSGNFIWESLEIEDDISNIRNVIYVRGGEEDGTSLTEDLSTQADGTNDIFQCGYRYSGYTVEVDSVAQDVGLDNINQFTEGYDVLYNFQEKTLRFAVAPGAGLLVTISGLPKIPIIVKKRDQNSIAEHGVYEFLIVDRQITSREAARQRARGELEVYRDTIDEGGFKTLTNGLQAGQEIEITSTSRGISASFIINRLQIQMHTPSEPIYKARIVSSRTYGMIDLLIDLLRKDAKGYEIGEDEVVDLVENFEEVVQLAEAVSTPEVGAEFPETLTFGENQVAEIDNQPTWVAGQYNPVAIFDTDPKRPMFADRSNLLA